MLLNRAVAKVYEVEQTTITIIACAPLNLMEDTHPCPGLAANKLQSFAIPAKGSCDEQLADMCLPLYAD